MVVFFTQPITNLVVCYAYILLLYVILYAVQVPGGCAMLRHHSHQLRPFAAIDNNLEKSDPKHNIHCLT